MGLIRDELVIRHEGRQVGARYVHIDLARGGDETVFSISCLDEPRACWKVIREFQRRVASCLGVPRDLLQP